MSLKLVISTLVVIVKIVTAAVDYQDCRCGQKKEENLIGTRVIGGQETEVNEFPWAALLFIKRGRDEFICGGTLINDRNGVILEEFPLGKISYTMFHDRFVVTAAHCIDNENTGAIEIRLGEHNMRTKHESEVFKTTAKDKDIIHSYKNLLKLLGYVEYDVAMIELEKPVNFKAYPHIRPVCLPAKTDVEKEYPDFTFGTVVGWGATAVVENRGSLIADLNSVSNVPNKLEDVELMNRRECDDFFFNNFKEIKVNPGSFCGVSDTGDSCQGDSGGGLVYLNPQTRSYELIGIVSYGAGCNSTSDGGKKLPGVYTNVRSSVVYNWIEHKVFGYHCHNSQQDNHGKGKKEKTEAPAHWGEWEGWSKCTGFGQIGKKKRERTCSDNEGKGTCGRLKELQERPCYLQK